jgi:ubiquinone/menaquinone biosynthesis C-methylase UbiE
MTPYIMEGDREAERLVQKTDPALVRRHLVWSGLAAGDSFVDFGCGTGEVLAAASEMNRGAPVLGIDAHERRVAHARAACEREGLSNIRFVAAQIGELGSSGLADQAFDHAWARFFLEYQQSPARVVEEMARVVLPEGRVTLIDIEGNGTWHAGMDPALRHELDAIIADLATTGFDPTAGRKLTRYAAEAGLVDIRHTIHPHHHIIGAPDTHTAAVWRRKIEGLRDNYVGWLFPHKAHKRWVFDAYVEFLMREDTMTWSVLHLVQGRKSHRARPGRRTPLDATGES